MGGMKGLLLGHSQETTWTASTRSAANGGWPPQPMKLLLRGVLSFDILLAEVTSGQSLSVSFETTPPPIESVIQTADGMRAPVNE